MDIEDSYSQSQHWDSSVLSFLIPLFVAWYENLNLNSYPPKIELYYGELSSGGNGFTWSRMDIEDSYS